MSDQTTHPSPEELSAFSLGQLPPGAAAEVESHISECQPCCETLLGLSSDDTFVELLQEAEQLPADQTVDQDGVSLGKPSSISDTPAPLAEHPRYEILGLIGKGGMGDVYKARHRMMDRTVALKIINRELVRKPEAVDRFHREVKTAARLSHPNIVTSHDAEQAGDVHFLVMEYVDGVDLAHTVKQQGALAIGDACEYVRQAAIGLQYAHEMGMVHRDIKPHNLMVTADGMVKILDFGLASLAPDAMPDADTVEARSDLTAAGSIMGTPDFISPEQADDAHQADIRSDIYSLGTTLYYLLSGRPPFADGSVMHKLKSHAQSEPEPIRNIQADVPDELAEVLRRMMAKNPAERFQTPVEVADALAPFVDRHRAHAPPPKKPLAETSRGSGSARFWKRLAVAVLILITGLGAAAIIYVQTDNGTVVIESEDENVEIAIRPLLHESHEDAKHSLAWQYRIGDTVTGSGVKRLRSGAYIVDLKGRENQFEVSQDRFVLKRGGKVIVRITRRDTPPDDVAKQTERQGVHSTAEPVRVIPHDGSFITLAWLPDGTLVTSDYDQSSNSRRLYFLDDSAVRAENGLNAETTDVSQLVASTNSRWLAAASRQEKKVLLWDAQQRRLVHTFTTGGLVHSISLSPDSRLLAAASWDGSAKVWSIESRELVKELGGYGRVHRVLFSPDGKTLAVSETPSGQTDLYDTATWQKQTSFTNGYGVGQIAFSPDGRMIATGGNGLKGSEPWKMWVRVWDALTGEKLMEFKEMQNAVSAVAISPDSRYLIAVGGNWGTDSNWGGKPHEADAIRIWDLTTKQLVAEFDGHDSWVRDLAFAPDGKRFATAGAHEVKVWNLDAIVALGTGASHDGITEVRKLEGHPAAVQMIAFMPQENQLVSAGAGRIMRWNTTTGLAFQIVTDRLNTRALLVSPDGKYIVSKSWSADFFSQNEGQAEMILWDATTGEVVRRFEQATSAQMLAFSPAGDRIVGGDMDDSPNVWDVKTGKVLFELSGHTGKTKAVAFSNDGTWIATGSRDGTCRIWNAADGGQKKVIHDGESEIGSLAILPDDRHIVIASNDHLWLYEVQTGKLVAEVADIRLGDKLALAISADGSVLATAETEAHFEVDQPSNTDIQLWQLPETVWPKRESAAVRPAFSKGKWEVVSTIENGQPDDVPANHVVISDDKLTIFEGGAVAVAFYYRLEESQQPKWIDLTLGDSTMLGIYKVEGDTLTICHNEGTGDRPVAFESKRNAAKRVLMVLRREARKPSGGSTYQGERLVIQDVRRNADGKLEIRFSTLAESVCYCPGVNARQTARGIELSFVRASISEKPEVSYPAKFVQEGSSRYQVVEIETQDGRVFIEPDLQLWPKEVRRFEGHTDMIDAVAFTPDGKWIVTGGYDETIRVWDVATGKLLDTLYTPLAVLCLAVSPDGTRVVAGMFGTQVVLWDLKTKRDVRHFIGHERGNWRGTNAGKILAVAFSPDGTKLASGGEDATLRVWDVASGKQLFQIPFDNKPVQTIAWTSDGKQIVCGEYSGTMTWCNVETGKIERRSDGKAHGKWFALSPDNRRTAAYDGIRDARTFALVRKLHNDDVVYFLSPQFTPDGKFIVAGSDPGLVRVWDAVTGQEVARLEDQPGQANKLAISPDGRSVAFGGGGRWSGEESKLVKTGDYALRVWRLPLLRTTDPR